MRVDLTNQHDSNSATAVVEVGCGLDGAEGNEPSFTYTINPDGLQIHRMTDNGETVGYQKLSLTELDVICGVGSAAPEEVAALKARLFPNCVEQPEALDQSAVLIPVTLPDGSVDFRPLVENETPTFCLIIKPEKAKDLVTSDPNGDRISIGAVTLDAAVGMFLRAHPSFCYDDIDDHMEV